LVGEVLGEVSFWRVGVAVVASPPMAAVLLFCAWRQEESDGAKYMFDVVPVVRPLNGDGVLLDRSSGRLSIM
jgi:hypothetical protein